MNAPTNDAPDVTGALSLRGVLGATRKTGSPALRRAICEYVDEVKSLGWPIERIIVRIKQIAGEESPTSEIHQSGAPDARAQFIRVVEQAISWAIAHYYGERPR